MLALLLTQPASFLSLCTGIILSAFYYGYIITPLPGGHLARKLGGATVIGIAVGLNGALTLFTPLAARMHVAMFMALRVAIGAAQVRTHSNVLKCQHKLYCLLSIS